MKTVYLVHGFNVRDRGQRTIDTLTPYFHRSGWEVKEIDYSWVGLIGVRICTRRLGLAISQLVQPGSVAVGHSNGCAILHYAAKHGAPFSRLAYINPALNKDAPLAPHIRRCTVWHSPSDKPVRLAQWLPLHIWGAMGAEGYVGDDQRYVNYNKEEDFEISSSEHSDIFHLHKLAYFGPRIVRDLESEQ